MLGFIARRVAQGAVALLVLVTLAFLMSRATGDPRDLLLPPTATAEDYADLGRDLGLDRPAIEQYTLYLRNLLAGDLGRSVRTRGPVTDLVLERLVASAHLAGAAFVLVVTIGLPLGVFSARRRGSRIDVFAKGLALVGQSAPAFWVGILLIQIFAVTLRWFPSGSYQGLRYIVLPAVTLSLFGIAALTRLMRSSVLEQLDKDFVDFARSKGLSERLVIWKHVARNAMLPVISFLGVLFAATITQQIVIETVFGWPGLGQLTYASVLNRDFPVVQGVVLGAGVIAISINLLTDISYAYLDPRIRREG